MERFSQKPGIFILVSMFILIGIFTAPIFSQQLDLPRVSQRAQISQRIGISDVTIVYHSPGVKEREIWGKQVPHGQVWRAGANENTTIEFSHDVKINGQPLKAGAYGLHMIPEKSQWTIIFSNNSTSWGSFSYKQEEDALRINVTPKMAEHREWLSYDFTDRGGNSATVVLHWEKLQVPFSVEVAVNDIVINDIHSKAGFSWQSLAQAANYCVQNEMNYEEAMAWIDQSIRLNENFRNLNVKSNLLAKMKRMADAEKIMDRAVEVADQEWMLNFYGYQLVGQEKLDKAIKVFRMNVERYPESWNVYDSLAEALTKKGDKKGARENYEKAVMLLPADDSGGNKERIQSIIASL